MKKIIEELINRGLICQYTKSIEGLEKGSIKAYLGIDPTADSLHVGHLLQIITLKRLQKYGIKTYILLGETTSMIGDPSFKRSERQFLDIKEVKINTDRIKNQVLGYINNKREEGNNIEIINNNDWYSQMNVIEFLRNAGKYITVNYMMSKESVKKRMLTGISFTEFSYQILQAYDYYYLNDKYKINLQIGGDDQWGNITSGIEMIRKKTNKEVYALTIKLLLDEKGLKFGKTNEGAIWLDSSKTSIYSFYQFWLNRSDEETERNIMMYSLEDIASIKGKIKEHKEHPESRQLQKALAEELTIFVHGIKAFNKVKQISEILFKTYNFKDLLKIDKVEEILGEENIKTILREKINSYRTVYEMLCDIGIPRLWASKSELMRDIKNGSVYINKERVESSGLSISESIKNSEELVLWRGKKYFLIILIK